MHPKLEPVHIKRVRFNASLEHLSSNQVRNAFQWWAKWALRRRTSSASPHRHRPTGMAYMRVRSLFVLTCKSIFNIVYVIFISIPVFFFLCNILYLCV